MRKKLFIKTFGCQMNVYDSARMADMLAPLGYDAVQSPDLADLVVLNTCHIREKAEERVFSELGTIRPLKAARAGKDPMVIAVAGCVAQAEGDLIIERAPFVDIVVGPQSYHRLPELIARARRIAAGAEGAANRGGRRQPGLGVLDVEFPPVPKFDSLPPPRATGVSAFLTVQEGCDKFCSFCVVPYTRGAEYSRPARDIVAEARHLVASGVREVTLLGQNVNAYHGEAPESAEGSWGLARLARGLAEIDGLRRIRYTTSHPGDMGADLIAAHGDVAQLMPFLHLPVQSGSDRVLAAMNRRHSAAGYLRIVEDLRRAQPAMALSSDFIVGYPGETDADFEATLQLVRTVGFAQSFTFKYSPRPGTPAAAAAQLPETVKDERLQELQALLREQQAAFNAAAVGKVVEVLVEKAGRKPGQLSGRTPQFQPVHFSAPPGRSDVGAGSIVGVRIDGAALNSLDGSPAESDVGATTRQPERANA